jgi:glutaminyl-peptide cyclotransferase
VDAPSPPTPPVGRRRRPAPWIAIVVASAAALGAFLVPACLPPAEEATLPTTTPATTATPTNAGAEPGPGPGTDPTAVGDHAGTDTGASGETGGRPGRFDPDRAGGLAGLAGLAGAERVTPVAIEVVATRPHDTRAFTQGLEVTGGGLLVESTGLRGRSTARLVDPATGTVDRLVALDDELFGEGVTVVDDEVWQLTWREGVVLVRGLDDLVERRRVGYAGEGWGLCDDEEHLVMSDGSSRLTLRDRTTFEVVGAIDVTVDGEPLEWLNELECVDGLVLANVYPTTRLVVIDPTDGRVVGEADLAPLVPDGYEGDGTNVANGIARDPSTGRFWLTGKRWPVLYEVELVPSG